MRCEKICIGDLRFSVEIIDKEQYPGSCEVAFLVPVKASVRAKIQTIDTQGGNSRLIFDNTNINDAVTHKFTIRFRADVQADDLLKFDNRYFKIQGFKDTDERKRWLVIYAVERGDVNNSRNLI